MRRRGGRKRAIGTRRPTAPDPRLHWMTGVTSLQPAPVIKP